MVFKNIEIYTKDDRIFIRTKYGFRSYKLDLEDMEDLAESFNEIYEEGYNRRSEETKIALNFINDKTSFSQLEKIIKGS